jgi:hypothetical protein
MSMSPSQRTSLALLAVSVASLASCHKPSTKPVEVKLDGPALATVLLTGDGWGEYAPCG